MAYEDVFKSIKVKSKIECFGDVKSEMERPERYTLTENFLQLPNANANIAVSTNLNFEILGTNADITDFAWDTVRGGVKFVTGGADNDQVIVLPHLDAKQTAWTGVKWGTENQTIWQANITSGDDVSTGVLYWAGLKLTNTPVVATDADQAFFRYSTDDSDTNWEVVYSVGGTDYTADSGVALADDTNYLLKIIITEDRYAQFYINGNMVHQSSVALTNDKDFIPYIGIQALSAAAENIVVHEEKISRLLYE